MHDAFRASVEEGYDEALLHSCMTLQCFFVVFLNFLHLTMLLSCENDRCHLCTRRGEPQPLCALQWACCSSWIERRRERFYSPLKQFFKIRVLNPFLLAVHMLRSNGPAGRTEFPLLSTSPRLSSQHAMSICLPTNTSLNIFFVPVLF